MRDVGDATAGPSQFVEIASALVDAGKQIVVEIEVPDGTRVRVSGASAQTVAHVASTLLHTRSERS